MYAIRSYTLFPYTTLFRSDGANDACVFERAGFAIAFNPKPILREYADVVITKKDLKAVIPVLESLSYQCCNQAQHATLLIYLRRVKPQVNQLQTL